MTARVLIPVAVEGDLDEMVARRLLAAAGAQPGTVYGKGGKPALKVRIGGYNNAARRWPWLVLVDLDRDAPCAPPLRDAWLPSPAPLLCFRVAVRAVEAWLLADAEAITEFLRVRVAAVPGDPEALEDPKRAMVNLARRSRRKAIRKDMVPREGAGRPVGPAYTSRLMEYVEWCWRPERATSRSDSLRRALSCVERLVAEVS